MNPGHRAALERLIAQATGRPTSIAAWRGCSGGCIHRAELITLSDGQELFVKSNRDAAAMFAAEASGLSDLAAAELLRVPAVIAVGALDEDYGCLIMEAVRPGPPMENFWWEFGGRLAALHRHCTSAQFGWQTDNFLGSTPQRNTWCADWCQFWGEQRLGFQMSLAKRRGVGSRELFQQVERLIARLDRWLAQPVEPPCLLHGDLWAGNYLVDEAGQPVLIDPAVYYGRREADLAMPALFGGFPEEFFQGYHDQWPLEDGWKQRLEVYKLYHLLNHLNLFGSGYLESCLEVADRLNHHVA